MATLGTANSTELKKIDKSTGYLKYWWPFVEMVEEGKSFKLGPQGNDGAIVIGGKTKAQTTKLINEMKKMLTPTQVSAFIKSKGNELPTTNGQTVNLNKIWKDNVKPQVPQDATKIGGRETEVFSEVLAQFCLSYAVIYGKAATVENCMDANGFKDDVWRATKSLMITPGDFNLNNKDFKDKLKTFALLPSGSSATSSSWINIQGNAMFLLKKKFKISRNVKIYNDKVFDNAAFAGNPYTAYLKAKTGVITDKWNPADMWVMTPQGIQDLVHLNRKIMSRTKLSVNVANNFLMSQFKSGDIIPVSLKKPGSSPHIVVVNSDEFVERIVLNKTTNPTIELTDDNRDMKINFTVETVKLKKGVSPTQARRNPNGPIGDVVQGSQKHIRIKYHVNNKKIELEYTQSGPYPSLAQAKMGSLGNKNFQEIINNTSQQGVKKLNSIQENYSDINIKTSPWFNGAQKITQDQYDGLSSYVGEIWKIVTGDNAPNFKMKAKLKNISDLADKARASELSLAIDGIENEKIKKRVITNLYEACASIGISAGLNKEEQELMKASGDVAPARKVQFHGSVHVKVY
jgi:hypothetical protein